MAQGLVRRIASAPLALLPFSARADALEHLAEKMVFTIQTEAGPIRFFCPSPLLEMRAETLLTKEPDMIRWIDGFAENSVFWDVGANVGVFSLYASMRHSVSILSFEPSAANFHVLSRNILLNRPKEPITAYCVALSGRTGLGVLNLASPAMGSSLSQFGQLGEMSPYLDHAGPGLAHGMVGFTMDDFIAQFGAPFPNYLKIDVDGLEWMILQGATKTLSDPRLRSAVIEISVSDRAANRQSLEFLKSCGLDFASRGETQGSETEKAANHLFVRRAWTKPGSRPHALPHLPI